jgi:hypothetical protein
VLTSLFGDLITKKSVRKKQLKTIVEPDHGFAVTAIMQNTATAINERGQMIDRHSDDLVVNGSPAQAIRNHFAITRTDLETATSFITILDPVGVWGSAVIKALSDASGRPIERLHLREQNTLRTLATIERTTVVRQQDETLRIHHAEVRAPGCDADEIPAALMERSQLSTVIVGPMQEHLLESLLKMLLKAVSSQHWSCPNLLFMLPHNASSGVMANKIGSLPWPAGLNLYQISEPMTGASAVWNSILGVWNQIRQQPDWKASGPILLQESTPDTTAALPSLLIRPRMHRTYHALDLQHVDRALTRLLKLEGLLVCAVVDLGTGLVVSFKSPLVCPSIDIEASAAASAQILRAHRRGARSMGLPPQIDEIVSTLDNRYQIIRALPKHSELFLVAFFDKQGTNLALARFQLMGSEHDLNLNLCA